MAAPFTQAYIQTQIDYYAEEMKKAASSQKYSYDEGPIGQFGVEKGDLEDIQKALNYWIGLMDKYYPDAYEVEPNITFNEIGVLSG